MKLLPMVGPDLAELMFAAGVADIWTLARENELPPYIVLTCIYDPSFAIFASLPDEEANNWIRLREYFHRE